MSTSPHGLRRRVTLACTLLGFFLSLMFAVTMVVVAETYEHILVEEILRGQAEDYSLRLAAQPGVSLPRTHRLSGYVQRGDGSTSDVPLHLLGQAPGINELEDGEHEGMHVGVFDTEHGRLYFVIDLSDIERLERLLALALVAVILGGTALAAWLGSLMARSIIEPVTRLAREVDALPVQARSTALAANVSKDELGSLARAIDRYQQRLVDADAAERAFFADASHELRSPVAVVSGALELVAEDAREPGARRRVQRMERGVRELNDLIDILFGLVRRREPEAATGDVQALLAAVAAELAPVRTELAVVGTPVLPEREIRLLSRAILRRLVPPETPGVLRVNASPAQIDFEFAPDRADAEEATEAGPSRSDVGLGLTLAGRLVARLGWKIEERGRQVRLRIVPPTRT